MGTQAAARAKREKDKKPKEDNTAQLKEFIQGFIKFVLNQFYNRVKKQEDIQEKLEAVFEVIGRKAKK